MNEEHQLRAYKFPDGQIKKKYTIEIKNIRDYQFDFPLTFDLWNSTVFAHEKGLFEGGKADPKKCVTLVSSNRLGENFYLNLQMEDEEQKARFVKCLKVVYNNLR